MNVQISLTAHLTVNYYLPMMVIYLVKCYSYLLDKHDCDHCIKLCLSVCLHFWSQDNLSHLSTDRLGTWFVQQLWLWSLKRECTAL